MFGNLVRSRFIEDGQTIITAPGRSPITVSDVWTNNLQSKVYAKAMVNGQLSTICVGYKDEVVEVVS